MLSIYCLLNQDAKVKNKMQMRNEMRNFVIHIN